MKKNVFRAYVMAIIGLLLGVIGMHRFYLELNMSGMLMLFIFIAGIASFAVGYTHLLSPLLLELSALDGVLHGDLSALADKQLISQSPDHKLWFYGGGIMCVASLSWLAVDLLLMRDLVRRANNS